MSDTIMSGRNEEITRIGEKANEDYWEQETTKRSRDRMAVQHNQEIFPSQCPHLAKEEHTANRRDWLTLKAKHAIVSNDSA